MTARDGQYICGRDRVKKFELEELFKSSTTSLERYTLAEGDQVFRVWFNGELIEITDDIEWAAEAYERSRANAADTNA